MSAVRLAMVVPDLAVGGLQEMAVGLALALDAGEFAPRFYTFDAGGPLERRLAAGGVPHVHLPRGDGIAPGHARRLARRFRQDGVGLVHCHNVTALFHGARAAWRAGRLPALFTEHDREMPAPWRHRLLHRWLARRVHRTVAVSSALREALLRYEGFPAERTGTLVNGIPDPRESYSDDRARARAELGWEAAPVLLAVGSLTPVKNHHGLLRIFGRVLARVPAVRLVVAGEGPLRAELEGLGSAGLRAHVTWLGLRSDVPRLLAAADVFVLPSHREGLPLSLVEAHGMGRPSVAYDTGGNGEVLVSGETGLLVPCGDEAAFSEALALLLGDPARAASLGGAARARYAAAYRHERMVAAYADLYRELLRGAA